MLNKPTTVQAADPDTGEIIFTHTVSTKMKITVFSQAKVSPQKKLGQGAIPQPQAFGVLNAKDFAIMTPNGTVY